MSNQPSVKRYACVVAKTINELVLKNPKMLLVIIGCICTNFCAAYMTILTTQQFAKISKVFKTDEFYTILKRFLGLSMATLAIKYIPYMIFNYYCQYLQRRSYILNLKEVMELDYVDFHSKTPGDLHYSIFIKSYASPMTCQVVLLDFAAILATIIFGATKVRSEIDKVFSIIFVITPIIFFIGTYFYIKRKMLYHYNLLAKEQYSAGKLTDKLLNYEAIKTYNLERREADDFYDVVGQQSQANIKMGRYEAMSRYLMTFTTNIPFMLIMIIMFFRRQESATGDFLTLTLLFLGQTGELRRLGNDLDQLVEYLNQINFSSPIITNTNTPTNMDTPTHNDTIEFEGVNLYYKDHLVIGNINVVINKGEKMGVIGTNGTGKSTFIKALLGFTKYTGNIKIDGQFIANYPRHKIMDLISYIPQDDCTSDDTVMNNILLGLNAEDSESLSKEQQISKVKDISHHLNAHETFRSLENGYETYVGPRGNKLSGGQKQKISMVRAFLKNAPIFIFDEATANMDKKYEKEAMKRVLSQLEGKTVLMIVHGKDYLHMFDRIIFLSDGIVDEVDTYENLMKNNEKFREILK